MKLLDTRIYKEGLTERAIILCKLNKSLLERTFELKKFGRNPKCDRDCKSPKRKGK